MSADNWAQCPRCTERAAAELERLADAVNALYGTVPVEEFDAARFSLREQMARNTIQAPTFREDYGIFGAEGGVVTVEYRGSCTACGLTLSFEENHPIPGIN